MEFTGERYINSDNGFQIHHEHYLRYKSILPLIKGKTVLDAACGTGYGTFMMSQHANKTYGIDIDEDTIVFANSKYRADNIKFIVESAENLPFEDSYFDVVVSFETIEHISEELQHIFLNEIKRVLKPDGVLIISTPNKYLYSDLPGYKNKFHVKEFYIDEFQKFISNYFAFYEVYHQDFHLSSVINKKNSSFIKLLNDDLVNDGRYIILVFSDNQDNLNGSIDTIQLNLQNYYYKNNPMIYELLQKIDKQFSKLYVDYGNGFVEENSLSNSYEEFYHNFKINFYLNELNNIKALRWDPIEGKICRVIINNIICKYNDGSINELPNSDLESNGENSNNTFDFFNYDPMIYLKGDFKNVSELLITGKIFVLEENPFVYNIIEKYERLKNDLLELHKRNETLKENNFEKERLIMENLKIIADNNMLFNDQQKTINSLLIKIDENEEAIKKYNEKQQETINSLLIKIDENEENIKKYNEKLLENNEIILEMNQTLKSKERYILKLENENENAKKEFLILLQEHKDTKEQFNLLIHSNSWKITKPLRRIMKIIKKYLN